MGSSSGATNTWMVRAFPRLSTDEPQILQSEHHLVHGRRADAEEAQHIRLRRRFAVDHGVVVDEGQVLALFLGPIVFRHRCSCALPVLPVLYTRDAYGVWFFARLVGPRSNGLRFIRSADCPTWQLPHTE
jgi:hypothetical protein